MFNREQLTEMSDADLVAVAENLGIKKVDLNNKDSIIYNIIDAQASRSAAEDSAKRGGDDAPKKRGRKKKVVAEGEEASAPSAAAVRQRNVPKKLPNPHLPWK